MNRMLSLSFALLLLAASPALLGCGRPAAGGGSAASGGGGGGGGNASSISGAEAHALVAQGATLLDVRTAGEWEGGHLDGALHIPISELGGRLAEVPREHPVVVYCASGGRSARGASLLASAGYEARDLGSMSNWE